MTPSARTQAHRKRLVDRGGRRLSLVIPAEAAEALAALVTRGRRAQTVTSVIVGLLLAADARHGNSPVYVPNVWDVLR